MNKDFERCCSFLADNMLRDVYIYYRTSFIRVESFCFILSSWKKFWLNRGWNNDKTLLGQ